MERFAAWAQFVSVVIVGVVAGMFVATQIGQVRVQKTLDRESSPSSSTVSSWRWAG